MIRPLTHGTREQHCNKLQYAKTTITVDAVPFWNLSDPALLVLFWFAELLRHWERFPHLDHNVRRSHIASQALPLDHELVLVSCAAFFPTETSQQEHARSLASDSASDSEECILNEGEKTCCQKSQYAFFNICVGCALEGVGEPSLLHQLLCAPGANWATRSAVWV
jgi:hypothetical protein